jgi:hypothetical protein
MIQLKILNARWRYVLYVACTYILHIPIEMPETGELVDFDGVPKAGKVDGVHLLLDER